MNRVLIVDDKEDNLYYLQALLTGIGMVVELARHGAEALTLARRSPPDLVVSDLLMPVMDGYTLLRHWKLDVRLKAIPFIVYTATYTDAEDERLALNMGADAFILKPAEPDTFLAHIHEVEARAMVRVSPNASEGGVDDLMTLYSRSLIRKLEEKTQQLEEGNRALLLDKAARERVEAELRTRNLEQRQLARALDVERQRLLAAQTVARVGNWENDLESGAVIWSNEIHRIHGTDPATFTPTHASFLERVHQDDRPHVEAAFQRSQEKPGPMTLEHRLAMDDGEIKHVEERWHFVFDSDGKPLRAIGTCQDITERKQAEAELRRISGRLLLATQSARIGIWDWDVASDSLVWDAQMYRLYGIEDAHFGATYDAWMSRIHPDDRERVEAELQASLAGNEDLQSQFRIVWPDGRLRELDSNGILQRAVDGTPVRMIGANRDITEQKASERRIRYLNRVYALLSSVNSLIVRATDRDELLQHACQVAVDIGGFKLAMIGLLGEGTIDVVASAANEERIIAVVGGLLTARAGAPSMMAAKSIRELKPCVSNRSQHDPLIEHPEIHAQFGVQSMVILPLILGDRAFGVLKLYASESDFFHSEEIQLLSELAGDVALASEHIDNRERLDYLASYDQLTGLANRSLFLERLGEYSRSSDGHTLLAVVLFDLERFRNINETLGRAAGDSLLKQIAAWLSGHLGDTTLISRIGGDHFAIVLLAREDTREVVRQVETMMKDFQKQAFVLDSISYRLSARVGIAMYPDDGPEAELLFKRAEAALKEAKETGARYLFYIKAMTESVAAKLTLERKLRDALDNGEFVLHYQPKIDMVTGLVTGAEALIRWNDPRTGLVAPGVFIPVLEETGLIKDVGQWALGQAVHDYLRWSCDDRRGVPIAVNVSPLQLRDARFLDEIRRAVTVDPRAATALALEITESVVMSDLDQSVATLQAIREMGISVAIDDFGTGFSSLAYLANLPIDTLKIDREFISNMSAFPEKVSLVSTMITLAHSLKLKVIAEGVETEEEAASLRRLRCDEIQGYLVSKPLPCHEFESRFLTGRPVASFHETA